MSDKGTEQDDREFLLYLIIERGLPWIFETLTDAGITPAELEKIIDGLAIRR
jgi:hypothetical protein